MVDSAREWSGVSHGRDGDWPSWAKLDEKFSRSLSLDGQKDLLWVLATVRGAHSEALALLLTDFEDLSSTSRFRALQQSLTA
jgi:hypothetical protein